MELIPKKNLDKPVWATMQFLKDFGNLPNDLQSRCKRAFRAWRLGVRSKGINCEKIYNRLGNEYRSIRGTRLYRMMYVERDNGAIFFLVTPHRYGDADDLDFSTIEPDASLADWDPRLDDADEQIEDEIDESDEVDDGNWLPRPYPLSDPQIVSDEQLVRIGVPYEDIGVVRGIRDENELLVTLEKHATLPQGELMALFDDPTRSRLEQLLRNCHAHGLDSINGTRPDELDYWRAASLEKFRRWFSPDQRDTIMAHAPGPMVVLGAAGTGKTVVALHRANFLARAVFNKPEDRILLTTFSRTLAQDLERQLDEICEDDPNVRNRIDVKNVDDAIVSFLNANGVEMSMDFTHFDERAEGIMKRAARDLKYKGKRHPDWLWQEYSTAIAAIGIRRESDYVGRVLPGPEPKPDDAEKKKLWPIFRRFIDIAKAIRFWTPGHAVNKAVRMLAPGGGANPATWYAAAVVDETQDMSRERLRFLAAIVGYDRWKPKPDILTFVGDARQRIYDHGASLRSVGIAVCEERCLNRNYRSTEEIRKHAERFLEGVPMDDLDGDLIVRTESPAARRGVPPEECRCANDAEEVATIAEAIRRWMEEDSNQPVRHVRQPGEYVVLSPSKRRSELLCEKLVEVGLPAVLVTAARPQDNLDQVRVMTLHRAKGLEFQGVVLDLDKENWPMTPHAAAKLSPTERIRRVNRAKCLAYVGMTRAIRRVLLTGIGLAPDGM